MSRFGMEIPSCAYEVARVVAEAIRIARERESDNPVDMSRLFTASYPTIKEGEEDGR